MTHAAILSCYDKHRLDFFAQGLLDQGLHLLASKGTRLALAEQHIHSQSLEEYSGQDALCLAKTLQSKLHEGLLVDQNDPDEQLRLARAGIRPIRLVCCDIYPLEAAVLDHKIDSMNALTRWMDVGGPALLASAIRSHAFVFPVVDLADASTVLSALSQPLSETLAIRQQLALKALRRLQAYYTAAAKAFIEVSHHGS